MTGPETRHLTDDEFVLLYYGEEDGLDPNAARQHLAACAECREARHRLAGVLAIVGEHLDDADPAPAGFERVMWARLQPTLALPVPAPLAGWRSWVSFSRFAVPLGTAALLAVAFVAGRWSGSPSSAADPVPVLGVAAPEGVLLSAAIDHLERSQWVLAEVLRADADRPLSAAERDRAADLVSAGRLIRQTAVEVDEPTLVTVIEELERVLLDVANGEADSAQALARIKARIEERGLLFRTRIVGTEIRERAEGPSRRLAPPVS